MKTLKDRQKVFGIGLNKTGTTTLGHALNMLGIKTIHYPSDEKTYSELTSANYKLSILNNYQAIVDTPVAPFYAQLDKNYPNSKFILTVREKKSWLRSIKNHFDKSHYWLDPNPSAKRFAFYIRSCVYGAFQFDEDRFLFVYDLHLKNVCEYFKGRPNDLLLLEITAGDGWDKLCPFLGFPVPDVPFPRLNQYGDISKWIEIIKLITKEIAHSIPPKESFILVDDNLLGETICPNRRWIPFLERNGVYWGRPVDDKTAVSEVDRLRMAGVSFIVFTYPSFWWLDCYKEFDKYLRSCFECVLDNDRLRIFDLRK